MASRTVYSCDRCKISSDTRPCREFHLATGYQPRLIAEMDGYDITTEFHLCVDCAAQTLQKVFDEEWGGNEDLYTKATVWLEVNCPKVHIHR